MYALVLYARKSKEWGISYYATRERAEEEMSAVREDEDFRAFHTVVLPVSQCREFLKQRGYNVSALH